LVEAPGTLEDEREDTVDKLKGLRFRTEEDPRPIYVSSMLTPKEEEENFKLLS